SSTAPDSRIRARSTTPPTIRATPSGFPATEAAMFRNLVLSAAAAGLAAGLLTAALQHVTTTPIILAAEQYESGEAAGHDHSWVLPSGNGIVATHEGHEADAWAPAAGPERTVYTSLSTVVTGIGFGLVLVAAMVLSGQR